jgi:hypothetical protein
VGGLKGEFPAPGAHEEMTSVVVIFFGGKYFLFFLVL